MDVLAVNVTSIRVLCARVHVPRASVLFPLCGFSGRDVGLLLLVAGKFDLVQLSWGILTVSDMFTDLLETFAMPCAHATDASV